MSLESLGTTLLTHMVCHERESSSPVCHVEVGVTEPGISVVIATAPLRLRDVIVKMDVDLLARTFSCNCIEDLLEYEWLCSHALHTIHTSRRVVYGVNCEFFLSISLSLIHI